MTFWNLKNDKQKATLNVYGLIGRWMDVDEREFAMQLRAIGDKDLDVYVNSDGGSVFTAITIYNMLARHKGNITFQIDGIAASAATIITSVPGAKVVAPVGTMMMIHDPLLDPMGPVNAKEMRELADRLDKVGGSIGGIYQIKTNLDDKKIEQLMGDETYLTALEAVDLGFADEVGEQMDVAAQISRDRMIVNGVSLDPDRHRKMPESWFTDQAPGRKNTGDSAGDNHEGEEEIQSMDLEKLKAEHPDLYKQVVAEGEQAGIKQERDRIKAIEDMAMTGHDDLVNRAKFETGDSAETVALHIVQAEKQRKSDFLNKRERDANPLNDVRGDGHDPEDEERDPEKAEADSQRAKWRQGAKSVTSSRRPSFFGRKGE